MGRRRMLMGALLLAVCLPAIARAEPNPESLERLKRRRPGDPFRTPAPSPAPIEGFRLAVGARTPFSYGAGLGYWWALDRLTLKLEGYWGPGRQGGLRTDLAEWGAWGALAYALLPGPASGGPYVEVGLGHHATLGRLGSWAWPLTPHLGFGTVHPLAPGLGLDLRAMGALSGLLGVEVGLVFAPGGTWHLGPSEGPSEAAES